MLQHFIPLKENNHKATLLTNKFLAFALIGFLSFNLLTPTSISAQSEEDKITTGSLLERHNEFRKEHNLGALKIDTLLNLSAQNKANELLRNDCWSHYCPDGRSPWEFFNDVGYDYSFAGENLAEGFYTIDKVMDAWVNSQSHRENILRDKYTEVGFGIAQGSYQGNPNNFIVVAHFGTLKSNAEFDITKEEVKITSPLSGQVIKTSYVDLTGKAFGYNKVNIFNNDNYESTEDVNQGIFTYKIDTFLDGQNIVKIQGVNETTLNPLTDSTQFTHIGATVEGVSDSAIPFISITPQSKNLVNLGFAAFIGILFLLDFLLLSRTDFAKKLKSYSHYHLALFAIIMLVIIVGGVAGKVGAGFFV
ncbi:MAG: CAP domain-containing protein [Candidatus Dojkabacteria bacterium]